MEIYKASVSLDEKTGTFYRHLSVFAIQFCSMLLCFCMARTPEGDTETSSRESGRSRLVDRVIQGVRSGAFVEEWARLPYVQRARVRLLLSALQDSLRDLENNREQELPPSVIDIDQTNLVMVEQQVWHPERDLLYPILLEEKETRDRLRDAVARLSEAKRLNPRVT